MLLQARSVSTVPIARLSRRFAPTLREENTASGLDNASPALVALFRGGFLRQSSAGIFSFLPNGERIKEKLERIIDQELSRIGLLFRCCSNYGFGSCSTCWDRCFKALPPESSAIDTLGKVRALAVSRE